MTSGEKTAEVKTAEAKTAEVKTAEAKTADTNDEKVFAPAGTPSAAAPGALVGVALIALAVIAIRDLLVHIGWLSGTEWLRAAVDWVAHIRWWEWMWPTAVLAIVVGLWLLWIAVKPRHRTHLNLSGYEVMWTRRVDIARRCSAAVMALPDVDHATTVVGRRKVRVAVTAHEGADTAEIDKAVDTVLAAVDAPLRARVILARRHLGGAR